jgi:DEAD/DEAH box helicase domain-containing protein
LDWDEKKAYVREVDVDYFTDANLAVNLKVLEADKERMERTYSIGYGDVMVSAMATIFKKIKFETHENIGSGPISLPEEELHTNAVWLSFEKEQFYESEERLEQALISVANALQSIAPLMVIYM